MTSAYLMRIEIGVEYNHGIGAPEINAHLTVIGVSFEINHGSVNSHPSRSCGQEKYEDVRIWCVEGVHALLPRRLFCASVLK
jgi:hypothetical protein